MGKRKVDIVTMGCSKNLVDSEQLLAQFHRNGYEIQHDPAEISGDIVIVNTCGFIGDAKAESVDMILELAEAKKRGEISQLYVMGCLSERYKEELQTEIPNVDKYYGKFDWPQLLKDVNQNNKYHTGAGRYITTPNHFAYLKISEGCNRTCSYCAIPLITGKHISRPIEAIVDEVKGLVQQGVKEFQVIAQDLTFYGYDLYKESRLADLIDKLACIPGVEWLRLHYAYPTNFPFQILDVMKRHDNVCNYLDIALQHVSDNVLQGMKRNVSKQQTYDLITKIREMVPGIHIRTTFMTGFPGETDKDFEDLLAFVKWANFDRLGVFPYSEEEDTWSANNLKDDVPKEVKEERAERLMLLQEGISEELNAKKIGQRLKVIIDRKEGDHFVGRTEFDSPEVDPEVYIEATDLLIGNFYTVEITDYEIYDLFGKLVQ